MLNPNKHLPIPNPKHQIPYYFLLVFVGLLWIIGCVPQPRYRTEPVEKRRNKTIAEEEAQRTDLSQTSLEQSKIDQVKMGRIIDSFLSTPYKRGGETKRGIDCSGLVVTVYQQYAGFKLPHDTKKLFKLVKHIDKDDLRYGDLVFFSDGWFGVSHVGIYIGEYKFAHSMEDFGVIVSSLDEDYYQKRYIGARRVIP